MKPKLKLVVNSETIGCQGCYFSLGTRCIKHKFEGYSEQSCVVHTNYGEHMAIYVEAKETDNET